MKALALCSLLFACNSVPTWTETVGFFVPDELSVGRALGGFEGNLVSGDNYDDERTFVTMTWFLMPREVRDVSDSPIAWYEDPALVQKKAAEVEERAAEVETLAVVVDTREAKVMEREEEVEKQKALLAKWETWAGALMTAVLGAVGVLTRRLVQGMSAAEDPTQLGG